MSKKTKCELLQNINTKIRKNRFKIQKKMRKKHYKTKSLSIFRIYLNTQEYFLLKYLFIKLYKNKKIRKNNLKTLVKLILAFECDNIFFRDYFIGVKTIKLYENIKKSSFYKHDKRVNLDLIVIDIITK
jgi:hypothetical protein